VPELEKDYRSSHGNQWVNSNVLGVTQLWG